MAQDTPQSGETVNFSDEREPAGSWNDGGHDLLMAPDEMLDLGARSGGASGGPHRGSASRGCLGRRVPRRSRVDVGRGPPGVGSSREGSRRTGGARDIPLWRSAWTSALFRIHPVVADLAGIIADFLAAGYNLNAVTWLTASGPSQVELVVIDWFRRWLGYPESAAGLFTSGGSVGSVDAFVAAREAAGNPERATVYMSDQSHVALRRAAMIVGVREECTRTIPSDGHFRLDMDALRRAVAEDRAAGFNPIIVCATAGTTGTGAIDPLEAMADYCESEGIWLHADAAYGGFAVVTEEGKALLRGIERADSIGLDAHKWFFQPYEAGCLLVKDGDTLRNAFAVRPDILQDTVWGANHPNFGDLGLQISRSFRALKVWMSVQVFGMAAFRRAVSKAMELAVQADTHISDSSTLEILSPSSLGVVCFRVNPDDVEVGEETLEKINRNVLARTFWEEPAFMSSTMVNGKLALRICILNHTTTWEDVRETLEAIERFGLEALRSAAAAS